MADESVYQEVIELQKALNMAEALVEKESSEKFMLMRIHQNLKGLFEKKKKESEDLNKQITSIGREREKDKENFDKELKRCHDFYKEQKLMIDRERGNKTESERELMKAKLYNEVRVEMLAQFTKKSDENDSLKEEISQLKRQVDELNRELEQTHKRHNEEIERINERARSEARDLIYEVKLMHGKLEATVSCEKYEGLKQELAGYKSQYSEMVNELSFLRRDKEYYLMEKNEAKLTLMKEIDELRMLNKLSKADQEKLTLVNLNLEAELNLMRSRLEDKNNEVRALSTERIGYVLN